MKVYIGNDHGGYELKKLFIERLQGLEVNYVDVGSHSQEIVRYPYYATQVAAAVTNGEADRGILICSTGIGMSIIANRFKGVRASLCTDAHMAKMTRRHNDSNLLCIGGKTTSEFVALDILETWFKEEFEGGRHRISLELIEEAEEMLCCKRRPNQIELFTKEKE